MRRYTLEFTPSALRQWRRLDKAMREQLARKLDERLAAPRVAAAKVREIRDGYKTKVRKAGVRLIYTIVEQKLVVLVLAVGAREGEAAYRSAMQEFDRLDD